MQRLNEKDLSERIDRFLGRKMEQFPELGASLASSLKTYKKG